MKFQETYVLLQQPVVFKGKLTGINTKKYVYSINFSWVPNYRNHQISAGKLEKLTFKIVYLYTKARKELISIQNIRIYIYSRDGRVLKNNKTPWFSIRIVKHK